MQELIQKLDKLKGILLCSSLGEIYLLKQYESVENTPIEIDGNTGYWPFSYRRAKTQIVSYISSLTLSDLKGKLEYEYSTQNKLIKKVNEMIDDRSRYLNLQRSLKKLGAQITITTRK